MNRLHRWYCRSAHWRQELEQRVLPWALGGVELGEDVLEVGPGPGLTTDLLRPRLTRMTALEVDAALAAALAARLAGTNVTVIHGDAAAMPFPDARFSGVVSFTMLHHVPSPDLQDRLLREVCRVLKPGGMFAGVDSLQSLVMRLVHIRDTLVPANPQTFPARLAAAGFCDVFIETNARAFRFRARRPA
ncbi:MAG: class I SAM-dependent methyltransferase [Acidobacteriia bacterium]|nr:class I SAM-dependent methyltransferase [Terriglobia bacterium]